MYTTIQNIFRVRIPSYYQLRSQCFEVKKEKENSFARTLEGCKHGS